MKYDFKGFRGDFKILQPFVNGADHVDVKRVNGDVSLDRFILGMLSYFPWWLRMLYWMRAGVANILGLRQPHPEDDWTDLIPQQVSFQPGDTVLFFKVRKAKAENYWIAETPEDKHLRAYVAVLAHRLPKGTATFHVVTVVHYKHWTGPVYFNLIRPFHHLVISRMARAGVVAGDAFKQGL